MGVLMVVGCGLCVCDVEKLLVCLWSVLMVLWGWWCCQMVVALVLLWGCVCGVCGGGGGAVRWGRKELQKQ